MAHVTLCPEGTQPFLWNGVLYQAGPKQAALHAEALLLATPETLLALRIPYAQSLADVQVLERELHIAYPDRGRKFAACEHLIYESIYGSLSRGSRNLARLIRDLPICSPDTHPFPHPAALGLLSLQRGTADLPYLVIGDSMVRGVQPSNARVVCWPGATSHHIFQLATMLANPATTKIILHYGTNDLFPRSERPTPSMTVIRDFVRLFSAAQLKINRDRPYARLVKIAWSDVLPRHHERAAATRRTQNRAVRLVNRRVRETGQHLDYKQLEFIPHPEFESEELYRKSHGHPTLHISSEGARLLEKSFEDWLAKP